MAVIVGQGISVSPVADAELSHESTSTVQNKVVTDAIASEYSTRKTYSVGDVCTHDGKLYECIVDIPTAEGWTLAHWKVSNLGDVASDLNRQLSDVEDSVNNETTGLDSKAPVILETVGPVAIASFSDGANGMPIKKLVANIEPVQDLHGYDHPWIGGNGKNLYATPSETVTNNGVTLTPNEDGSVTLSGEANSVAALFYSPVDIPSGSTVTIGLNNTAVNADIGVRLLSTDSAGSGTQYGTMVAADAVNKKLTFTTSFAAKSINVFAKTNHGAVNITLKVMVELGSTSGAFEPYENICPITGHTGITGKRTGKNLYDINYAHADGNNNLTIDGNELVYTANNAAWAGFSTYPMEKRLRLHAGVTYTVSAYCTVLARDANYDPRLCLRNMSNTIVASKNLPSTDNVEELVSFSYTPSEDMIVYLSTVITGVTAGNASVRVRNQMVEIGSAVTDYEPYAEKNISVNWQDTAGTVYGGTLDVISGKMVVNRAYHKFTESDNIVANTSDPSNYRWYSSTIKIGNFVNDNGVGFNLFEKTNGVVVDKVTASISGGVYGSHNIFFYNLGLLGVTNAGEAKQYVVDNGVEVCYYLDAPVEHQLTPQEVTTLLGNNVIWTDVGPVSVEYSADTKMYIEAQSDEKQDKTSYVNVSGSILTLNPAVDNTMYLCGELTELTVTAPASGIFAVRFNSGSTPTVATFTGVTWLNGFDSSSLEANKTYEINILNGLGVAAWT